MSSPDSEPFRLSRRRALAGAAWSAPAIVVASAVPAYAVSPGGDLDLRPGESAAVLNAPEGTDFYDLQFTDLSVFVPSALSAGLLTLTVTYIPSTPGGPAGLWVFNSPSGWIVSPEAGSAESVVFTYGSAVAAATEVPVDDGIFVGAGDTAARQTGAYVVTASATGFTSDMETFVTGEPLPDGGGRAVPRGVAR